MLIDTHCHIHEADYPLDRQEVIKRAHAAGVMELLCVGTSQQSSLEAVKFVAEHAGTYASIGVHPHETTDFAVKPLATLLEGGSKVIAIGEIGLDYFYNHSPRGAQIAALEAQIDLAMHHNLPVIFHVREAFSDFWSIFDNFHGLRGELHSFTDSKETLEQALTRGLYIGVNGISTFVKSANEKAMFAAIPLYRMLLETDAPFLTPVPFRGTVNEPAFVRNIAEFHAKERGLSLEEISATTTANARALFAL